MTEGAEHYGVKPEYIQWLKNHEQVPRKTLEEMKYYPLPDDAPTMSFEEVQKNIGENGGPIYFALNGKVMQFVGTNPEQIQFTKKFSAGKHVELGLSKMLYDPKFGNPQKIEDFDPLHRATLEDMLFNYDTEVP